MVIARQLAIQDAWRALTKAGTNSQWDCQAPGDFGERVSVYQPGQLGVLSLVVHGGWISIPVLVVWLLSSSY